MDLVESGSPGRRLANWPRINQGDVAEAEDVLWKLRFGLYYIHNFSLWLDVLIVAKTIRTIFSGFEAR